MKRYLVLAGLALAFGLSYTQAPLYIAHYYFFFGLSKAGFGFLAQDWLAQGIDPFPVFSTIIKLTYQFAHPALFYIYPLILAGVYVLSFIGITFETFPRIQESKNLKWLFIATFFLLHSKLFYDLTLQMGWVLTQGVANYYLLGPIFQPSMFGVFLLLSILMFLRGKTRLATLIAALVTVIHSTYLLSAGSLTLAYMICEYRKEKTFREPIIIGLIGLAIAIPVIAVTRFALLIPTSPELMAQAQNILVNFRIPHHTVPSLWITNTLLRIPYVLAALWLIRRTKLALPLLVLFTVTIVLSALQIITDSNTLALISPWRMSVLLVPISTVVFAAFVIDKMKVGSGKWAVGSMLVIVICSAYGTYKMSTTQRFSPQFSELREFVMTNTKATDTYLVPPRNKAFQHFRLSTGIPIYANFKLHPFRDTDIIEWHKRVNKAQSFYEAQDAEACDMIGEFSVTHVITTSQEPGCTKLTEVFNNYHYHVYNLR